MNRPALFLCLLGIIGVDTCNANAPQSEVVLISLSNPVYPRLALQARVAGDVELNLNVRPDGTVESADVISGPPMLKQAALDSARQSRFECRECAENISSYRITYSFQLVPADCEVKTEREYPKVSQSQNRVSVIDQAIPICDLSTTTVKVRSVKCLFLWKCGKR